MKILIGKSEEIIALADEIFDEKMTTAIHIVVMEDELPVATSRLIKEGACH